MSSQAAAITATSNMGSDALMQRARARNGTTRQAQPVGIIGPSDGDERQCAAAYKVAAVLGAAGVPIVCGGRGGVMEAASRGAAEAGGIVVGILPDEDLRGANPYLTVALPTGIGEMRNALISRSSVCLVAIGGGMGTLSEMALGLKWGKPVFTLYEELRVPGARAAGSVEELIEWVLECLAEGWESGSSST